MRRRWPELLIVLLGVGLRLSFLFNFDPIWGFDYYFHVPYTQWFADHFSIPPLGLTREAYHPPLYYFLTGLLVRAGLGSPKAIQAFSVFCGVAGFILLAWVFARLLRGHPVARRAALGLAAILPCAVHLDGMSTGEPLNGLLALAALWMLVRLMRRGDPQRRGVAVALGALLALELLTKVSALILIGLAGAAVLLDLLWWPHRTPRALLRRALPGLGVLVVLLGLAGWYPVHNFREHGKFFLSGYDGDDKRYLNDWGHVPYLQRRPLGTYLLTWTDDIYRFPFYPAGVEPTSRFFPQLVASTYADYYNYRFSGDQHPGVPTVVANQRPVPVAVARLASGSVAAGTLVFAVTAVAYVWLVALSLKRRRVAHLALLGAPLLALVGQIHFAVVVPIDMMGPVKGHYAQFAAAPAFAVFGIAVEWLLKRRGAGWAWAARALGIVAVASLAPIAAYSCYCRWIA